MAAPTAPTIDELINALTPTQQTAMLKDVYHRLLLTDTNSAHEAVSTMQSCMAQQAAKNCSLAGHWLMIADDDDQQSVGRVEFAVRNAPPPGRRRGSTVVLKSFCCHGEDGEEFITTSEAFCGDHHEELVFVTKHTVGTLCLMGELRISGVDDAGFHGQFATLDDGLDGVEDPPGICVDITLEREVGNRTKAGSTSWNEQLFNWISQQALDCGVLTQYQLEDLKCTLAVLPSGVSRQARIRQERCRLTSQTDAALFSQAGSTAALATCPGYLNGRCVMVSALSSSPELNGLVGHVLGDVKGQQIQWVRARNGEQRVGVRLRICDGHRDVRIRLQNLSYRTSSPVQVLQVPQEPDLVLQILTLLASALGSATEEPDTDGDAFRRLAERRHAAVDARSAEMRLACHLNSLRAVCCVWRSVADSDVLWRVRSNSQWPGASPPATGVRTWFWTSCTQVTELRTVEERLAFAKTQPIFDWCYDDLAERLPTVELSEDEQEVLEGLLREAEDEEEREEFRTGFLETRMEEREAAIEELEGDLEGYGVPVRFCYEPPRGFEPYRRQKPMVSWQPSDPDCLYVVSTGLYGVVL